MPTASNAFTGVATTTLAHVRAITAITAARDRAHHSAYAALTRWCAVTVLTQRAFGGVRADDPDAAAVHARLLRSRFTAIAQRRTLFGAANDLRGPAALRALGVPGRVSPVAQAADPAFLALADDPADLAAPSAMSSLDSFQAPLAAPTFRRRAFQEFVGAATADASGQHYSVAESVVGEQLEQCRHRQRNVWRRSDERITVFAQIGGQLAGTDRLPGVRVLQHVLGDLAAHVGTADLTENADHARADLG
jgi:hypothetical protein